MVRGLAILGAVVLWGLGAAPASAADCASGTTAWTNAAGGSWFDAANWTNGVPSADCSAVIAVAGTYTVDLGPHGGEVRGITLGAASGTQTLHQFGEYCLWKEQPCPSRLTVGADGVTVGTNGVLDVDTGEISIPHGAARLDGGTLSGEGIVTAGEGLTNAGGTVIVDDPFRALSISGSYTQDHDATLWLAAVPAAAFGAGKVRLDGTLRVTGHAPLDSGPMVVVGSREQRGTFSNVVFDDQAYEVDYDRGAVSLWPPGSTCQSGSTAWTNPDGGEWDAPANWSNGRPSANCDAFITLPGTYEVSSGRDGGCGGAARSVTIGGTSGTQTLHNSNYGSGLNCPSLSEAMRIGSGGMVINQHGALSMFSGNLDVAGSIELAGTWSGRGSLRAGGGFHNTSGTITLGSSAEGGDYLAIDGDYTQGPAGTLQFTSIPSDVAYDDGFGARLSTSGGVTLDGTLDLNGAPPVAHKPQRIIRTGGTRTGTFASVTSHRLPYGARYAVHGVDLVPRYAADSKSSVLSKLSARPKVFSGTTQIRYRSRVATKVTVSFVSVGAPLGLSGTRETTARAGRNTFVLDARCGVDGLCLDPGRYRVTLVTEAAAGRLIPAKPLVVRVKSRRR